MLPGDFSLREHQSDSFSPIKIARNSRGYSTLKALAKLENTACQTLLFVSVSLVKDNIVTADLRLRQYCLASNVGQFFQSLRII